MRNQAGIKKRLARAELCQRDIEFKTLALVLADDEALTPDQAAAVNQQMIQLFQREYEAGVPVLTSLKKLPEPIRSKVCEALLAEPNEVAQYLE